MASAAPITSVDLSRLPAPQVVEALSFETILAGIVTEFRLRFPAYTALLESDPAMKLLEVFAYRELLIRQNFNERAVSMLLAHARGPDLDNLAAYYGVTRLVVTPADPVTGAAAVLEDDDTLRRRVLLAPDSFSVAGPESAYVFHALTADGTIADASAIMPSAGQVLVSLLSRTGDGAASPAQIAAVAAVLTSGEVRPLTDEVIVASAVIIPYAIEAGLQIADGPDRNVIMDAASASLTRYVASRRKLGALVSRSGIIGALQVEGVETLTLSAPDADVLVTRAQVAHPTSISVVPA